MAQRILVVDDTPANIKLLGDLLRLKGYEVTTAVNGEQALESIAAQPPDLVLLDIMMPGINGYEVCRKIRDNPATALLPVVLATSLDPAQERVKGIEAGADDFLSKPAAVIALRSVGVTEAVSAMTGMCAVPALSRICLKASMPLIPGSWMSISTRSGFFSFASLTPSSPVSASSVA